MSTADDEWNNDGASHLLVLVGGEGRRKWREAFVCRRFDENMAGREERRQVWRTCEGDQWCVSEAIQRRCNAIVNGPRRRTPPISCYSSSYLDDYNTSKEVLLVHIDCNQNNKSIGVGVRSRNPEVSLHSSYTCP